MKLAAVALPVGRIAAAALLVGWIVVHASAVKCHVELAGEVRILAPVAEESSHIA
jgi:hypothetical protein